MELQRAAGVSKCAIKKTIEIKRVYVKPEFRRKGISKLLMRELENWGRHLGYSVAILETGNNQKEAVKLYESTDIRESTTSVNISECQQYLYEKNTRLRYLEKELLITPRIDNCRR